MEARWKTRQERTLFGVRESRWMRPVSDVAGKEGKKGGVLVGVSNGVFQAMD